MKTGRVLVVGDDMRIFLSIVRSFGRANKTIEAFPYGPSPALKSRYVARIHSAPIFDNDQEGWRKALLTLLGEQTFDIVIPCSDPAIIFLDSQRHLLTKQRLAIPDRDAMDVFYDKQETHVLCDELGIAMAPWGRLAPSDTAAGLAARYGIPLVLKPRRTFFADGNQSREVVEIADSKAEAQRILNTIPDRARYIVEGFFVGDGVGVSVLSHKGRILQSFQHRRLREGHGGPSSFRVSESVDPDLRAACAKITDRMKHTGVCMFEFRHDRKAGQWILIETNARFWGSMALPLKLGLDYPNMLYDLMLDGVEPKEKPYKSGYRSRNFMLDGYYLLKRLRTIRASSAATWLGDVFDFTLQPLRWLMETEHSDSFALYDLKPALWEFIQVTRKLTARSFPRSANR